MNLHADAIFFWESGGSQQQPQWAVREGDWKLVHNPLDNADFGGNSNDRKLYLFNIRNDVSERMNEADAHPEIVNRLEEKYEAWLGEVR